MGFSVFYPDSVFDKREKEHSAASRIENLDGVIYFVSPLGNFRVEFLENFSR